MNLQQRRFSLLLPYTSFVVTADAVFSGITTFAKLPWVQCLTREEHIPIDIAFLGAPFVSERPWIPSVDLSSIPFNRTLAPVTDLEHASVQVSEFDHRRLFNTQYQL